ncbi:DNA-binding MarR family transcriptional regulator [Arthrobacter globiformis]|uniref:MarR family winged helix-turn-helix transcriptional regulator n=1 Tax=Arthrobacter globiformis TaxID=1665 RepID=UPI0027890A83|nr:MarR family winged helix-turn-helix transcriptional regulator [Arthrobacter globiformis]MDQ1058329.1 DNA-binding MarR family transcriptional regulator [Arthrobacter globiformis]
MTVPGEYEIAEESPYALLSTKETRAWYAYMKVQLRLRYEMNRQLREDHGLSLADYDILVALISDDDATLSVSSLATRIGWERSRVSHHARRMSGRGLVHLQPSATDKRSTAVSLTKLGRTSLAAASPGHIALVKGMFLSVLDDQRMDLLAETFEMVYEELIRSGTLPRPVDHP